MTSESALAKIPAHYPFDGSEGSDIILRTSDHIDFSIHKVILSIASPFFKDMFSLPQGGMSDPVVHVSETSKIIDPLLRLCYPVDDPVISDLTLLFNVLEAAMKYQTTEATKVLTNLLRTFVQDKPLEVFVISCRLSLEETASLAAQRWKTMFKGKGDNGFDYNASNQLVDQWKETIAACSYIDEMVNISAGAFYRLTQFLRTGVKTSMFCGQQLKGASDSNPVSLSKASQATLFNFVDSDITVLSRDGFEFKIHSLILRLASPRILDNATTDGEGRKTLQLPYHSRTLYILFQECYPSVIASSAVTIQDISSALSAAVKYKMTKVVDNLNARLKSYTDTQPLSVYFGLLGNGFWEEAAKIARSTLCFKQLSSLYVPMMEEISAESYYHLLLYRQRCRLSFLEIGSKYAYYNRDKSMWWSIIEQDIVGTSDLIHLASLPIVEKNVLEYSSSQNLRTTAVIEKSKKLKKEWEESLSKQDTWFKDNLNKSHI